MLTPNPYPIDQREVRRLTFHSEITYPQLSGLPVFSLGLFGRVDDDDHHIFSNALQLGLIDVPILHYNSMLHELAASFVLQELEQN